MQDNYRTPGRPWQIMCFTKLYIVMALLMCTLAILAQCGRAVGAPVSRPLGYSLTINGTAAGNTIVLATQNYIVSLEGDPCALTVRHLFSNPVGHLVWTANYFVGSLSTSTKCTLTLTTAGDLQLFALFMGSNDMIWNSNTAGKGVTSMALEDVFDSGDFRLLDGKQVVYSSFGVKEFAILPTQTFRPGDKLVGPDDYFNDTTLQILFEGTDLYELKLEGGDLRLYASYSDGPAMLYWSLKQTLYNHDLSQVAYAAVVLGKGGIGLYTNYGRLVWTSGPIPPLESNPHDTYFGVDTFGNLQNYYLVKGEFWTSNFQAIPTNCDLPSYCGPYGLCSEGSTCSCPKGFVANKFGQRLGCNAVKDRSKCNTPTQNYLPLPGYDSVFNQYAKPLKVKLEACKATCSKSCYCDGFYYDSKTESCYTTTLFQTLRKVSNMNKVAYIKL